MSPRRAKAVVGRVDDDPAVALREHLVDTAARLTSQGPIAAITTREIARAAGVSDGVLYNYFSDKHDLLVEALLRRFQGVFATLRGRMPQPGSGTVEGNLASVADTLFEVEGEIIPLIAGLVADPLLFHRLFAALHADPRGPEAFREPLASYLTGEQGLGRIRADADTEAVTLLLLGSTAMLALGGQFAPDAAPDTAERVRAVVALLLQGLQPA